MLDLTLSKKKNLRMSNVKQKIYNYNYKKVAGNNFLWLKAL